ncbi:MAG TPA: multiple monosaccharide ABC transporter permease [Roseiarcus sp.]|nr:multiple monosaccharide ABC transporter permease [Roseiarcus sp.]
MTAPALNTSATREMRSELLKDSLRDYGLLFSLLLIVAFFYVITENHVSVAPVNITNLVMQNSYVVIMALGMLLVIVVGHIDLSVGSIVGFVGAVAGSLIVYQKMPYPLVIVISLAIGAAIGAAQGVLVAYGRMPSFIVTLGGMLIFRGLTGSMLLGQFVGPFPRGFQDIASGFISNATEFAWIDKALGAWGHLKWVSLIVGVAGAVVMFAMSLRRWTRARAGNMDAEPLLLLLGKNIVFAVIIIAVAYNLALYKGLPVILVIMGALTLFYGFVTTRTVVGRRIYAIGGNSLAARLSGVKTERLIFLTFANMGLLAGLAGLVVAARLNSSTPSAGNSFELDVIAACFIGGVSASGGVGKVMNVVIGALFMGVMNNGMSLIGLGIFWQQVVKGLVLLAAVGIDVYQKSKG